MLHTHGNEIGREHLFNIVALLLVLNIDSTLSCSIPDSICAFAVSALDAIYEIGAFEEGCAHIAGTLSSMGDIDSRMQYHILMHATYWTRNSDLALALRKYIAMHFLCVPPCVEKKYYTHRDGYLSAVCDSLLANRQYRCIMQDKTEKHPLIYSELTHYLKIIWFIMYDPLSLQCCRDKAYELANLCWGLFSRISDGSADIIEKTKVIFSLPYFPCLTVHTTPRSSMSFCS